MSDELNDFLTAQANMAALMTDKERRAWLLELERERLDQSWKTYRKKSEPTVLKETIFITKTESRATSARRQRQRDQIMFHAGRYAMGARDEEAINASKKVGKLIQK